MIPQTKFLADNLLNYLPQLICFLISLIPFHLPAQSAPHFDLITLEEGISNGFVTSIYQDEKGLIWLGTANGLNRFDGYAFRSFLSDKGHPNGLSHPVIWAIAGDKQGHIWIGTDVGLNKFDPTTETFTQFFHDPDNEKSLSHNLVLSIEKDTAGNIWIGTANGLNVWGKGEEGFTRFFYNPRPDILPTVKSILSDKDGTLWIGSLDTLYQYQGNGRFLPIPLPPVNNKQRDPNYIRTIYEDSQSRLWVGTEANGVFVFEKGDKKFSDHYSHQPRKENGLSHNKVTAVLEDDEGNYWVATYGGGLNIINEKTKEIKHFNATLPTPPNISVIRSMLKDAAGNVWLGTAYEGLYLIKKYKKRFRNYSRDNSGLNIGKGCTWAEAENGNIWIGTNGGGLHLFDPDMDTFLHFRHDPDNPKSLVNDNIHSITADSEGQVWLNLDGGILAGFEKDHNRFTHIELNEFGCGGWLTMVFADRENNIWIGNQDGLCKYTKATGQLISYLLVENDQRYGNNRLVEHIYQDRDDDIWIATHGGLNFYDKQNDTLIYYPCEFQVYSIYESKDGTLWTGTQNGLAKFDRHTKALQYLDHIQGLPKIAFAILEDGNKMLWLNAPTGLYHFDPVKNKAVHYNRKDGLINNQFLHGCMQSTSGEMFFSGISGFTRFRPEDIVQNPYKPPVVLTNFQLFNKDVPIANSPADTLEWTSPLQKGISYTNEIELKHWQNDFSIEFAALDFTAPENNKYQYQLEGYDRQWITKKAQRRFAHYTNLAPGNYVFKVKAANNDGVWNEEVAFIHITILPPWYRTSLAYLLWAVLIFSVIYTFYYFQLNRQLVQAENRRLQELDAFKTRFYTNITHEFRTPLTIILGMADQMKDDPRNWFSEGIRMIKRNGRNLLNLVNQMLDLRKLESGNLPVHLQQGDMINYLKYLTESFQSYAATKNIRLHFLSEATELLMDYDPEKILHIVSNLLSNAIKFTHSGGDVYLIARIIEKKPDLKELELKIRDTGIGIPPDKLPNIFDRFYQVDDEATQKAQGAGIGLTLTKELVKLLQGNIAVSSKEGEGTEFTLTFPITQSAVHDGHHDYHLLDGQIAPFAQTTVDEPALLDGFNAPPEQPLLLIIEDNKDVITYLGSFLGKSYRLEIACDGQRGIDKAIEQVPDLIICDVMMPEKDGFEVCQILKNDQCTSHIPIIMLTAKADIQSKLEGLESGADAYLAKPSNKDELLLRIRNLIETRQELQARFSALDDAPPTNDKGIRMQDEFLQKLRGVLKDNLDDENFGITQLCRALSISRTQLHDKLKALTGKSTSHYIRSIRLHKARELLRTTDLNISEVAYEVGFRNAAYFSTTFLEEFGISPREERG